MRLKTVLPLLMTFACLELHATIVPEFTVEEMTKRSDLVITGAVLNQEARILSDGRRIDTYVHVLVLERLKGESTDSIITVELLGGTIGTTMVYVPGEVRVAVGEKVVLFLTRNSHEGDSYRPFSFSQSKFRMVNPVNGVNPILQRDLAGLSMMRNGKTVPVPQTLEELKTTVRQAILK